MSDVLVLASILSLVFAVVMAVIASKLLRENRARSAARVHALQELVAHDDVRVDDEAVADEGEDWDRALGEVRSSAFAEGSADRSEFEVRTTARTPAAHDIQTPARMQPDLLTPNFALRTSNSELTVSPEAPLDHPLFEGAASQGRRLWIWIPTTAVVIAIGIGGAYTIFAGVLQNASASADAKPTAPPVAGPSNSAAPIELLSLRHSVETPGAFVVTGLVQNPPVSAVIKGVYAVVYLFDDEGRYFASSKAALDVTTLSPGGEAAFTVRVTPSSSLSAADVRRYRVSFQQQDGAAVSHVDRRGTLPEGTTGAAVETATPPAAAPANPAKPKINARK